MRQMAKKFLLSHTPVTFNEMQSHKAQKMQFSIASIKTLFEQIGLINVQMHANV